MPNIMTVKYKKFEILSKNKKQISTQNLFM